jgi:23S rRNA pseudouridine2605 synthase
MGSRRGCEQIIVEGRVSINGRQIKELGTKVEPGDQVAVDGKSVRTEAGVVLALNKPRGYLCTRADTHDRMTIYDLLPAQYQTLHHVGRLDKESEGLILLTNRGDLSHRLIHPSQGAEKEYEVVADKPMDAALMGKLVKGMMTEEGFAKAERAWLDGHYRAHVVLKQGLKRQIRLMFYQLGFEVERLVRTRIGWLELRGLPKGGWKELSAAEVERFLSKEGATGRKPATKLPAVTETEDAPPKRRTSERPEGAAKKRVTRSRPDHAKEERPARGPREDARGGKPPRGKADGPRKTGVKGRRTNWGSNVPNRDAPRRNRSGR